MRWLSQVMSSIEFIRANDIRAKLILEKVSEIVLNPQDVRGLGFCCKRCARRFMARFFDEHGLPSLALSANSASSDRVSAQQRLRDRSINFIFEVDLYNEGVDIPEVDTVLFLRPTESLTVFLQQLGRGLRLHPISNADRPRLHWCSAKRIQIRESFPRIER